VGAELGCRTAATWHIAADRFMMDCRLPLPRNVAIGFKYAFVLMLGILFFFCNPLISLDVYFAIFTNNIVV